MSELIKKIKRGICHDTHCPQCKFERGIVTELERQAAEIVDLRTQISDSDTVLLCFEKAQLAIEVRELTARAELAEARNLAWDNQPVVAYEYSSGAGREEGRPATLSHKFHTSDEDMSEFELIVTKLIVKLEPIT